jgi:hypothetical protein
MERARSVTRHTRARKDNDQRSTKLDDAWTIVEEWQPQLAIVNDNFVIGAIVAPDVG